MKRGDKVTPRTGLLICILSAAFTIVSLSVLLDTAAAAYKPAPEAIHKAAQGTKAPRRGTAARRAWIICRYFPGRHCRPAVNVAWCESTYQGRHLNPRARNGQYRGVFQMGHYERGRFGHSHTVWGQAKAARRYHRLAGWRPWECRG